jgi:nitrate/TMAO reductase-like tetraheme cytochrome c subunit
VAESCYSVNLKYFTILRRIEMKKLISLLWKFKFVIYVLILLGIGFSIGALESTMDSKFCGACHEMDHVYNAWSKSTHANYYDEHKRAGCMSCHSKPGLVGLLQAKFGNGSKSAYYHVVYMFNSNKEKIYQKIIRKHAHAPHEACFKCHKKFEETDRAKAISFPHHSPDCEFRDEMCSKCHQFVVHSYKGVGYEPPNKKQCYDCHKKEEVEIESCETCHAGQAEMRNGKGATGVVGEKDVMLEDVECTDCHSNSDNMDFKPVVQSCIDCHDGDEEYGMAKIKEMQQEVKEKLPEIKKEISELREAIKLARRKGIDITKAEKMFNQIIFNYNFLKNDGSKGVHNHEYVISILEKIDNDIAEIKNITK